MWPMFYYTCFDSAHPFQGAVPMSTLAIANNELIFQVNLFNLPICAPSILSKARIYSGTGKVGLGLLGIAGGL